MSKLVPPLRSAEEARDEAEAMDEAQAEVVKAMVRMLQSSFRHKVPSRLLLLQ